MSSTSVEATPSQQAIADLKARLGDVLIDETPEEDRKPVILVDRPRSPRYSNRLTPPVGTSYWRLQSFVPMDSVTLIFKVHPELGVPTPVETLTWRVDAYVYVVNARPDDLFQQNGGAIYVVLVHSGSAATGTLAWKDMEYRYVVSLKSSSGSATKHLPHSNSGVQSGDDWQYPISFSQDLQMFQNNGNESFTFQAGYEDSIDIHKGRQTGDVEGISSVRWGVVLKDPKAKASFPFGALSVFKVDSLNPVTFDCVASVYTEAGSDGVLMGSNTESITVNCQFSP